MPTVPTPGQWAGPPAAGNRGLPSCGSAIAARAAEAEVWPPPAGERGAQRPACCSRGGRSRRVRTDRSWESHAERITGAARPQAGGGRGRWARRASSIQGALRGRGRRPPCVGGRRAGGPSTSAPESHGASAPLPLTPREEYEDSRNLTLS